LFVGLKESHCLFLLSRYNLVESHAVFLLLKVTGGSYEHPNLKLESLPPRKLTGEEWRGESGNYVSHNRFDRDFRYDSSAVGGWRAVGVNTGPAA
jgi:hypothetical protein